MHDTKDQALGQLNIGKPYTFSKLFCMEFDEMRQIIIFFSDSPLILGLQV